MIKRVRCPGCGEIASFDESDPSRFCMMCGHKLFENVPQKSIQTPTPPASRPVSKPSFQPAPVQSYPKGSNLIVTYSSEHPRVNMIITFISTRYRENFYNGTTKAYNLDPGTHSINFTIGKRTYRRDIYISPNGIPVTVHASWRRGVARIEIINPPAGSFPMPY